MGTDGQLESGQPVLDGKQRVNDHRTPAMVLADTREWRLSDASGRAAPVPGWVDSFTQPDSGKETGPERGETGLRVPSGAPDAKAEPRGVPAEIPADARPQDAVGLQSENDTAILLAKLGYDIEQNPDWQPGDSFDPAKNPDYRIQGDIFDHLAPQTARAGRICARIAGKVTSGQADRIIVDFSRTSAAPGEVAELLASTRVIPGLKEVVAVTSIRELEHLYLAEN